MSGMGSIRTNIGALEALNGIARTASGISTSETQLSTGLSISSPADNPAGYMTAQGFTSEVGGLTQALSNASTGVSLAQTAEGGIQQQISIAQQLYAIAVQSANGTETNSERQSLQGVVGNLLGAINSIATNTTFNGQILLDGTFSNVQFQVGATEGQTQNLSIGDTQISAIGGTQLAGGYKSQVSSSFVTTTHRSGHGNYSSGSFTIAGSKGSATIQVSSANESAHNLAEAINAVSSLTGVTVSASTSVTYKFENTTPSGSAGTHWGFGMVVSSGPASGFNAERVPVDSTPAALAAWMQRPTVASALRVTTTLNAASSAITFSNASGLNISIGAGAGGGTRQMVTASGVPLIASTTPALTKGTLTFQSSQPFTITNGSQLGLTGNLLHTPGNTQYSLANINVSTASGAETAMGVIKGAISTLEGYAAGIGAFQDGLTVLSSNISETRTNATNALGAVQDANLPQAAVTLTQQEIAAQTGVAALKNSVQLQQSFLSLLP